MNKDKAKELALLQARSTIKSLKQLIRLIEADLNGNDEYKMQSVCLSLKALDVFISEPEGLDTWVSVIEEQMIKRMESDAAKRKGHH